MNAAALQKALKQQKKVPKKEWGGLELEAVEKGKVDESRRLLEGFSCSPSFEPTTATLTTPPPPLVRPQVVTWISEVAMACPCCIMRPSEDSWAPPSCCSSWASPWTFA